MNRPVGRYPYARDRKPHDLVAVINRVIRKPASLALGAKLREERNRKSCEYDQPKSPAHAGVRSNAKDAPFLPD